MVEDDQVGEARGQGGREDERPLALAESPQAGYQKFVLILSLAAVALIGFWLYQRALGFAYFNDDPTGHFAWMAGRSIADFFAGSAEYGYYRPVVFTVLRITETLFGNSVFPHNPVADHTLLLLLHGANVALVWLLAYRLGGRVSAFAWIAALVFAFTPFHYEAVAYVASLTHPLHVFWLLLALLLFDRGRETTDRRYLTLSALAQVVALFAHENGLFILPALIGLDWVNRPQVGWRERARSVWPYALTTLVFTIIWLMVPKNSEQGLNTLSDIGRNTIPFLQTSLYPLLPLLRLDAGAVMFLVAAAVVAAAFLGWLARRLGAGRLWLFAVGWIALASLPSLLFLGPAYLYGSPRLSYLPSIGVALLWAIPGLLWANRNQVFQKKARSYAILVIYIAVLILPTLPFIRCQLDFYGETSRIARNMVARAASAPEGREVLFVNAPFFFSSYGERPDGCPNPYPWTPTGGVLIPPYGRANDFVRFNGGPDRPVNAASFPGYAPGWRTFGPEITPDELRSTTAGDAVYVFDLFAGDFSDLSAAWQPGASGAVAQASFGTVLGLTDGRIHRVDNSLTVDLVWHVAGQPEQPLLAFVHIYNSSGQLVAQADGPPGGGLVAQTLWQVGDGLREERSIDLSDLPAGRYKVAVGVYSAIDGGRLPATAAGEPLPDNVTVIGAFDR
ncbi:MAG: hypothetical protein R6X18_03880 [Chloroflexota bacterium]|jgi:hypothetical protein